MVAELDESLQLLQCACKLITIDYIYISITEIGTPDRYFMFKRYTPM